MVGDGRAQRRQTEIVAAYQEQEGQRWIIPIKFGWFDRKLVSVLHCEALQPSQKRYLLPSQSAFVLLYSQEKDGAEMISQLISLLTTVMHV